MYETTHVYDTRPARRNRWWLAALAVPVTLLLILAGCALASRSGAGAGADRAAGEVPAATGSAAVDDVDTAVGSGAPGSGDAGDRGGAGSSGGGETGGGTGSGSGDSGEPPYIRDLYEDAFTEATEDGSTLAPTAIIQGHAFDPDGPDEQERVARVDIDWGDGSVSPASLGGHGAFGAQHVYPAAYAGRTVTVRVVAYGHDGRTAVQSLELALPIM